MFRPSLPAFAAAFALTGCLTGSPPEAPAWDTDVYPIIRGSCSHCHGETYLTTGSGLRFDVCNPRAFQSAGADVGALGAGALPLSSSILTSVEPKGGARPSMPRVPAEPLSDYERTVIRNWVRRINLLRDPANPNRIEIACEKSSGNSEPRAKFVSASKDGNDLVAIIDVTDPDGDVVLGKAEGASADSEIKASGRRTIRIAGGSVGDKLKLKLSDGYATVEVELTTK